MLKEIFSGIYKDFTTADLHSRGDGFDSEEAIIRSIHKLQDAQASDDDTLPIGLRTCSLPAFIADRDRDLGPINILDFGGSVGFGYYTTIQCCPGARIEKYDVVEGLALCKAGSRFFDATDTPVRFHSSIPADGHWDWGYLNSTLQYIDDYSGLLSHLANCCRWILLDDVPTGNNPDFVSIQRYYSSQIPHRFFSEKKLLRLFEDLELQVCYQGVYFGSILGKIDGYPMHNFPGSHRIKFSRTYLLQSRRGTYSR